VTVYQQINLYQPVLAATQQKLSATTFAAAIGLVIVVLAGLSVQAHIRVRHLQTEVDGVRADVEQRQQELEQRLAAADGAEDPRARVVQLAASLEQRKRALDMLRRGAAGQATGFASRMEALARRHVDGLWIEHMTLSGVNGSMSLGGVALDPSLVPTYLHSLAQEQILNGTRFDEFIIERPDALKESESKESTVTAAASLPGGAVRFRAGNRELPHDGEDPS
jgi:hypothetical protein